MSEERTNEELADVLGEPWSNHELSNMLDAIRFEFPKAEKELREAAARLRANDGERIEGCEIGSAFIHDNYGGDSVTVKLPPGVSLHEMLLQPCTLILNTPKERRP